MNKIIISFFVERSTWSVFSDWVTYEACHIKNHKIIMHCFMLLTHTHTHTHIYTPPVRFYKVLHIFVTCRSAPIIGAYLLMVLLSRHLMKLYRPFELRRVLIVHNFLCSILSLYSLVFFIIGLWEVGTDSGID